MAPLRKGSSEILALSVRSSKNGWQTYKVPKEVIVLDELPLLPIGKVDKKALKARHMA